MTLKALEFEQRKARSNLGIARLRREKMARARIQRRLLMLNRLGEALESSGL